MERRRLILFSVASTVLIAVVVVVMFLYLNRSAGTAEVRLPEATAGPSADAGGNGSDGSDADGLVFAELRPDTVQYILQTIEKPKSYSGSYTVENFWGDDSSVFDVSVYVKDDVFRVTQLCDSYMKEMLVSDSEFYIWYMGEDSYYHGLRGEAHEGEKVNDAMQMAGSYRDLLGVPVENILETAYVELESGYCVYVSALVGELGYRSEYYISLDTGLLLKNEVYDGETPVCRMIGGEVTLSAPADSWFTLPNGVTLS